MRKYTLIAGCILAVGISALACTANQSTATDTKVQNSSSKETLAFSSEAMPQAYKSVISKYKCLIGGAFKPEKFADDKIFGVAAGFSEAIKYGRIGYILCDLNYDGSPELLIGEMLTPETKDRVIIDAYMLKGGQPVQIFSSTDRDRHYYINDYENERILIANEWSNGASYSGRTYFRFTNERKLKCIDSIIYKDEQWYESVLDGSLSDNLKQAKPIEENFALDIIHNYESMYTPLDFIQIESKASSSPSNKQAAGTNSSAVGLQARYAKDVLSNFSSYTKFKADHDGSLSQIVFSVAQPIKNVKFLNVELIDVDDNGKANFSSQEIYSQNVLEPQKPLVVEMNLPETVPTHGISYTDGSGQTKKYIIGLSGQDGSIFLTEF